MRPLVSCIALLGALVAISPRNATAQQVDTTWVAPPSASTMKSPLVDQQEAERAGKVIYERMCVICHGEKGDGKGVASVTLEPRPADFLSIRVEDESDGAIFWKLTHGKPPMASYATLLNEDQRWELVAYLRTLEAEARE